MGGPLQLFQVAPASLRDELDDAVVPVRDPAGQPQSLGAADQEIAEADALDVAFDDAM